MRALNSLPQPRLEHLRRMSDETGLIQHARYSVPNRISGYTTDDNARALVASVWAARAGLDTSALVDRYLAFLQWAQRADGSFHNEFGYDRRPIFPGISEDATGHAAWALGEFLQWEEQEGKRALATELLLASLPAVRHLRSPRAQAFALLGLTAAGNAVTRGQAPLGAKGVSRLVCETTRELGDTLVHRYFSERQHNWHWFEDRLTYANGALPAALFAAAAAGDDRRWLAVAEESLGFLDQLCLRNGRVELIGNHGWYVRGGRRAVDDEQPVDAAWLVLAHWFAHRATDDPSHLDRMAHAASWFAGCNRWDATMIDGESGGCFDGVGFKGINRNEGAESLLALVWSELASAVSAKRARSTSLGSA